MDKTASHADDRHGSTGGCATATGGATTATTATIRRLDAAGYVAAIPGLAALLVDAVEGGAAVNFLAGLTDAEAAAWWRDRIPQVADDTITALVAVDGSTDATGDPDAAGTATATTAPATSDAIIGSVLLIRSRNPNAPHRAEIGKVLVHRRARRRGLGRALMQAAEDLARAEGRWLLILDTHTGSDAEVMYRALGWTEFGQVPDHSLLTDGTPSPTTFFWKDLR